MSSAASNALSTLHAVHLKFDGVQEELIRGPRQINARKAGLQKKKDELEACRQRLKQHKLTADQKNLQLKTNEAKIGELRAKLNQAASNREYEILTGQIDADTMANSVLEDEILEALTMVDQIQAEVKRAEQDVATAEAELQKVTADIQAREPGLKQQAESYKAELVAAEKVLPPDIVPQYRRAAQAYGAGALAAVENKACSSCRVQLTSQKLIELNSGKVMFCTCGCLLYSPVKAD